MHRGILLYWVGWKDEASESPVPDAFTTPYGGVAPTKSDETVEDLSILPVDHRSAIVTVNLRALPSLARFLHVQNLGYTLFVKIPAAQP